MSRKETLRAGPVKAALANRITNEQGAHALAMTARQFQRLKQRFRAEGVDGLVHRARGRPSPRQLPASLRADIEKLMTTTYDRFNDVHLSEKLREVHGLAVSRASVRALCSRAGPAPAGVAAGPTRARPHPELSLRARRGPR